MEQRAVRKPSRSPPYSPAGRNGGRTGTWSRRVRSTLYLYRGPLLLGIVVGGLLLCWHSLPLPRTGPLRGAALVSEQQQLGKLVSPPASSPPSSGAASTLPSRIVAVGDLHADYGNALTVLQVAGVADGKGNWIGGNTTLVQTGDIVDRGPDTVRLYRLFMRLREQAVEAGGHVIQLLGNHEIMNMLEDYRYVTREDMKSFGGEAQRLRDWSPTGWLGQYLRTLDCVTMVEGNVFLHGGLHPFYAAKGLDHINEQLRKAMASGSSNELYASPILSNDGPLWYRGYALEEEPEICDEVVRSLSILKAKRMVMGHTVQEGGLITTRCGGRIVLIDIGISAIYGRNVGALEIQGDVATALYRGGRREALSSPTG